VGNFLAVTAVRDLSAQAVAQAIAEYARTHGLDASVLNGNPGVDSQRAGVFAPVNGWTTVWPPYFNIHDIEAATALSDATQTLVPRCTSTTTSTGSTCWFALAWSWIGSPRDQPTSIRPVRTRSGYAPDLPGIPTSRRTPSASKPIAYVHTSDT
jgi:hypothetical protein